MSALWHPVIRADWLVLRRTGLIAWTRLLAAPALLVAGSVALVCGDLYLDYGWCIAAGTLLALGGSYAVARHRLLDTLERWTFGWCGALPTARYAAACTLLLVAAAALVVALACVTALLWGVSMSAPHRGDLFYGLTGVDLGLIAGVLVAGASVSRRGVLARMHDADGVREPLLALPWLNDPRLPHVLDWQRRAALVRWRRGGGAAMAALALFAIPDGATVMAGAGLVLFIISLTWLDVVLRACAKTAAKAAQLLQPVPMDGHNFRIASFRYPLLAMVCAFVLTVAGSMLMSGGSAMAGLWGAACVIATSAWPLGRVMVATRHPRRSA